MKNKFLLFALFCALLLSVGSVCAADADINVENVSNTDVSVVVGDLNSNDDNGVGEGSNSTNSGAFSTFSDIQKRIGGAKENDTILLNNTTYYGNGSQIVINKSLTIDGNGSTLDAQGLSRIFNITANKVTLLNLKLINGKHTTYGVCYSINGFEGGAVYWSGDDGFICNCSFIDNMGETDSAICWSGFNGTIVGTEFRGNWGGP